MSDRERQERGGGKTRAEKVEEAQRLREAGVSVTAIAERMGVSRSAASSWLCDPDLSKQKERRQGYAGACEVCGAKTDGSWGPALAPRRCVKHPYKMWTREGIIEAIQAFADRYGAPPSATDFNVSQAQTLGHPEKADRFYRDNCWPHLATVQDEFGSWANAIEAAGFPRPVSGRRPSDWDRDSIIAAIRQWVSRYGEIPRANGWLRASDEWPTRSSVDRYFGTWNAAIRAAGFVPRQRGSQRQTRERAAV